MTSPTASVKDRAKLFTELLHYFDAYRMLTEQIKLAADAERISDLENMTQLRQQTLLRIEQFEKAYPELLAIAPDDEPDEKARVIRAEIRRILTHCQSLEEGLDAKVKTLRDNAQKQAKDVARGQRGIKGYSQGSSKRARYVETSK